MNDHDLLITIKAEFGTKLDTLASEVSRLSDGTKAEITQLFNKVDVLEKKDISLEVEMKQIAKESGERFYANAQRIKALEDKNTQGVQRTESNKAYIWRKVFETALPFIYALAGGIFIWLVKSGIIHN